MAWAGDRPIGHVDVSVSPPEELDRPGRWLRAELLEPNAPYAWTRWERVVDFERPGFYVLRVRATDGRGTTQPLHPRWNYRGVATNSVHAVAVQVRPG